ncbi:hypothetical protein [Thermus sp. NEB1569]|uniref:hypothetical protein n=1 Tax=Thermus sp. NEB1569 TaxID=2918899 RepID=UPI001EFBCF63|nr:hypothetical protein [Thermus sp. NEB1569]ULR39705.1 hypothetical protein MI302_00420 [Thermus sp. NEB1569]
MTARLEELLRRIDDGTAYLLLRRVPYESEGKIVGGKEAREAIMCFVQGDNYAERYGEENFDVFLYDPPEHWSGVVKDWWDRILDEDAEGELIGSIEYADEGDPQFWETFREALRLAEAAAHRWKLHGVHLATLTRLGAVRAHQFLLTRWEGMEARPGGLPGSFSNGGASRVPELLAPFTASPWSSASTAPRTPGLTPCSSTCAGSLPSFPPTC